VRPKILISEMATRSLPRPFEARPLRRDTVGRVRTGSIVLVGLALLAAAPGCGGSSGGSSDCPLSTMTCGTILTEYELAMIEPLVTDYNTTETLPCSFSLESNAGGIFQAFCGGAALLTSQIDTTMAAYPTATFTETDTVGMKSWEILVGDPMGVGSFAEVSALTTNGKYVFNVSTESAASDIVATRQLAAAIDTHLSAH
jgi:hypothetical protein